MIADLLARVSQSETLSLGLPCGPGLQASRSEPRRAKTGDNPSKQRSMDEGTDDSSMRESAVLADYPADMVDGANARLDEASYYTVNNKNLSSPPEKYAESDSAEEEEKGQGEVEAGKSGPVADKPMFELGEVDETLPLVTIADVEQLASALKSDLSSDGEKAVVMWYVDAEKIAKGRETGEKANRTYSTTELSCRVLSTTEVSGVVHLSLERDITKFVKAAVSEATLWTENQRSREFKEVVDEYVEPSKPVIRPARLIARKPTELIPLPALQRVVLAVDEEAFATVASKDFREYLDNFPKAKRYAFVLEFGDATGTREFVACTMHQYLKFLYGLPKLLGRGGVVRLPLTKEVKYVPLVFNNAEDALDTPMVNLERMRLLGAGGYEIWIRRSHTKDRSDWAFEDDNSGLTPVDPFMSSTLNTFVASGRERLRIGEYNILKASEQITQTNIYTNKTRHLKPIQSAPSSPVDDDDQDEDDTAYDSDEEDNTTMTLG